MSILHFISIQLEYNVLHNKAKRNAMMPRCHSQSNITYHRMSSHTSIGPSTTNHHITLKKSIFNPPPGLEHVYRERQHITGVSVPEIVVVFSTPRWLLLQAPTYSHKFFRRLNKGRLGSPSQALLEVFRSLVRLS